MLKLPPEFSPDLQASSRTEGTGALTCRADEISAEQKPALLLLALLKDCAAANDSAEDAGLGELRGRNFGEIV